MENIVSVSLDNEQYQLLEAMAQECGLPMENFICGRLFGSSANISVGKLLENHDLEGEKMPTTVKFSLDDAHYQQLEEMAKEQGLSIQDLIRHKLFDVTTVFTPQEALTRALAKYQKGDHFTIPELYGEDWTLERGAAGIFGRQFYNFVLEHPDKVRFVNKNGRHAQYEIV